MVLLGCGCAVDGVSVDPFSLKTCSLVSTLRVLASRSSMRRIHVIFSPILDTCTAQLTIVTVNLINNINRAGPVSHRLINNINRAGPASLG